MQALVASGAVDIVVAWHKAHPRWIGEPGLGQAVYPGTCFWVLLFAGTEGYISSHEDIVRLAPRKVLLACVDEAL